MYCWCIVTSIIIIGADNQGLKGGEPHMRKMIALLVSIAFSLSVAGIAAAQTPATKPAEAPKTEKKAEKKETKADCLKMAKDDAAKAECEKKFAKAPDAKKPAEATKKP
jgi:hypothetical protein